MSKFNKDGNAYILVFAIVMTLVLGSALAFVSESLKEKQQAEREFERKKFILSAALGTQTIAEILDEDKNRVNTIYNERVKDFVVNENGELIENLSAGEVITAKEYKKLQRNANDAMELKPNETLRLPVYTISKEGGSEVEFMVVPTYGFGLWDNIWGYIAVQGDLNTVQGVIFDHKGETPGLGARITETAVQNRYIGKKLYDADGTFQSVNMQKGEGADYSNEPHKVNGMTGATITGNGLNYMFKDYVMLYRNYFNSLKEK